MYKKTKVDFINTNILKNIKYEKIH